MEFYGEDYTSILAVLDRGANREDAYAVQRTCHELARLVLWKQTARLGVVQADILSKLAPTIEFHVELEPDVIVSFCRFLRRCISLKEPTELDIQSKVTEAGLLSIFRRALEAHFSRPEVFNEVCRVLALLCFDMPNAPHADNQGEIAESGLIQLLLDRLRQPDAVGEENAALACEVVFSVVFENETTASHLVDDCGALSCLSELIGRFPESPPIILYTTRTLFQLVSALPPIHEELIELQFLERTLDFLELHHHSCDALLLWHALKFLELAVRNHELPKDEFCRCRGPAVVIQAIQHTRAADATTQSAAGAPPELLACLYYVGCMLFCRVAASTGGNESMGQAPSVIASQVFAPRVDHLVASSAHQFALQILKTMGSNPPHVAEQAIRLLEFVAMIDANRIPLTRLGASRQLKVVYNSTEHAGLLCLCERAIAAIEGT